MCTSYSVSTAVGKIGLPVTFINITSFHGKYIGYVLPMSSYLTLFGCPEPQNFIRGLRNMLYLTKSCKPPFQLSFCSLSSQAQIAYVAPLSWAPIACTFTCLPHKGRACALFIFEVMQHSQHLTNSCRKKRMLSETSLFIYFAVLAFYFYGIGV